MAHARTLLRSGADKVVVNTTLFDDEVLIEELASDFGQQCIVASIDVKHDNSLGYQVWIENGEKCIAGNVGRCLRNILELPVGELYLNSIDRDGTGQGYDLKVLEELQPAMPIPVIIAGGAGQYHHLAEGLKDVRVDAVATAHLFNFVGDGLAKARLGLLGQGFSLGEWDIEKARSLNGCAMISV